MKMSFYRVQTGHHPWWSTTLKLFQPHKLISATISIMLLISTTTFNPSSSSLYSNNNTQVHLYIQAKIISVEVNRHPIKRVKPRSVHPNNSSSQLKSTTSSNDHPQTWTKCKMVSDLHLILTQRHKTNGQMIEVLKWAPNFHFTVRQITKTISIHSLNYNQMP
jgi:hypothetical protein